MGTKPFTAEQVIAGFTQVHGNIYDYSSMEYVNALTHINIICSKHGIFRQTPKNHVKGNGCRQCFFDKNKSSFSTVIEKFVAVHGDTYSYNNVIYVNTNTKVLITCPHHGDFAQKPSQHLVGYGCPLCKFNNIRLNQVDVINRFKKIHADTYDYSKSIYISSKIKLTIICHVHGEFQQTPSQHLRGAGCFKCGRSTCTTDESDVISRFQKIHGNRYDYSNLSYINSLHKVNIICYKHGDFKQSISCHSSGKGCPKCSSSKGENKIRLFLDSNDISYIEQHPICKNPETNYNLRVDFYLPAFNTVIEYDGMQHFKAVDCFGGQEGFKNVVKRDAIKNMFCQENKVDMLRISYKNYKNIDTVLNDFLANLVD